MPRITHIKKAQQRYITVPITDDNGQPLRADVNRTTKRGRQVSRKLTRVDHTQPLPEFTCDHCRKPIGIGTPYKWIQPKSGPYGGRKRTRHESCPSWHPWEYSSALWARLAEIEHNAMSAFGSGVNNPGDVESIMQDAAEEARAIAEEKRESAENIREGFGHDTYQSEELDQQADNIESWADDLESFNVPELPEPECDCPTSDLSERITITTHEDDCPVPNGEPTDDQMDEWRDEVESTMSDALQAPV